MYGDEMSVRDPHFWVGAFMIVAFILICGLGPEMARREAVAKERERLELKVLRKQAGE